MSRRRSVVEHGLIFVAALVTLPLALYALGPFGGFGVLVVLGGGLWLGIAATIRLDAVTAVLPTIAALTLLLLTTLIMLAASEPPSSCPPGQTGFMDCGVTFEGFAGSLLTLYLVVTGVLVLMQFLAPIVAKGVRERLPPSARLPMEPRPSDDG